MSYLHYFFIVNFTLRIYQSHGFLPLPIRKLIEIRNTVMDANYYIKNYTHKSSLGTESTLSKASRTDLTKHFPKVPTLSSKSKPYYRNRYANGKIKVKDSLTVNYANTGVTTNTRYYYEDTNKTLRYILITDDQSMEALPSLGLISIKRTVNENDITRTLPQAVIGITRTLNENDITRTLPQPVIGITRTVNDIPTRTLPQPSILKHNTSSLLNRKVTTDIGQREKVTKASDSYFKTKDQEEERPIRVLFSGHNFLKATNTLTASSLGMPGAIQDLNSGEIGPIRVLIEDDTDFEPDYISFTNKPHKIAFFDITKAIDEDDTSKKGDLPDDLSAVRRTSPFDRLAVFTRTSPYDELNRITRTSPSDELYGITHTPSYDELDHVTRTSRKDAVKRVTRPSQKSTVYKVLEDRINIPSNNRDMEPFRILIEDDSNSKNEYNLESDFYEKDDVSVRPSAFAIKQDSWKEKLPWAYQEFPETDDDTSASSLRTSLMTTSTQVSYGKESLSNENNYSSYGLSSTWPAFTIRNYFAQLFITRRRSTARTDSLRIQDAPITFPHLRSKIDKDVTKQIKHLTGAILYSRSRIFGHPNIYKPRTLQEEPKRPKEKDTWECYDCGMKQIEFGQQDCYNIFGNPNHIGRYLKNNHTKKCKGPTKYHGQCFTRYLDVGSNYDERGCRSFPPPCGRSYASEKFVRLEYLLKKTKNGCVTSPHAVLMPFSRTIQLYVRFHVCVCEGRRCNVAKSTVFNWTTSLIIILYLVI